MDARHVMIAALVAGCGGAGARAPALPRSTATDGPAPTSPPAAPTVDDTAPTVDDTAPAVLGTLGTAHPITIDAVSRHGAWAAICQARRDTNGDGAIEVKVHHHGETYGDAMVAYLVVGAGEGEPIDQLVSWSDDDRWLVALRGGALALFDVGRRAWTEIPRADLRDDTVPMGRPRQAALGPDGGFLTYFRNDQTVVVRDLATGRERPVTIAGARLWRAQIDHTGRYAQVLAIRRDTDGDGALTWPSIDTSLSPRGCRGPIASYSTAGWHGDEPEEVWIELASAKVMAAPPTLAPFEEAPDLGAVDDRPVLAVDAAGRKLLAPARSWGKVPRGPLTWVAP